MKEGAQGSHRLALQEGGRRTEKAEIGEERLLALLRKLD